jgi:hypothetical protein
MEVDVLTSFPGNYPSNEDRDEPDLSALAVCKKTSAILIMISMPVLQYHVCG